MRRLNILALWLIALGLALFNTRFICFCLCWRPFGLVQPHGFKLRLLRSTPNQPDSHPAPYRSGLILADGSTQAQLVSFKKAGQPVQVFRLQRFWPLLLVVSCSSSDYGLGHTMPSWWPLLKCHPPGPEDSLYIMLPRTGHTRLWRDSEPNRPRRTVVRSARNLAVYSLILLILSLMASYYPVISWLAAVFAPLGHEIVIWMGTGMYLELNKNGPRNDCFINQRFTWRIYYRNPLGEGPGLVLQGQDQVYAYQHVYRPGLVSAACLSC